MPVIGSKLVREWNGRRYEVTTLRDGFEFEGRKYRSLSAIAKGDNRHSLEWARVLRTCGEEREMTNEGSATLRDLHQEIHGEGSRAGVQLAPRPARGVRGIHRQPAA